jgi:hypothetical protein
VTGLKSFTGTFGVEFLEYELPLAGRPLPNDSHPTDLWHWQTTMVVSDLESAAVQLDGLAQPVSAGIVALPDLTLGFRKALLVRDPDGHAIQIVSP